MTATEEQRSQMQEFFHLMSDHLKDVILHPIVDNKDVERLGICVVDRSEGTNDVYLLGLWLLPGDNMFKQLYFKEDEPEVLTEKPRLWQWKNFVRKVSRWCGK